MRKNEVDVIVLGGGIIGLATSYYLSKEGKQVIVIEKGGIASGSSGANAAFTLVTYRPTGPLLQMGMASLEEYDHLSEELGVDIEFERCGVLYLITSAQQYEELKPWIEEKNNAGLSELRLLNFQQTRELEPNVGKSVVGSFFNPWDGHVNPYNLLKAFKVGAEGLGAKVLTHTKVAEVNSKHDGSMSVVTDKKEVMKAPVLVNACGIHSPLIGKMLGIHIPIKANKEQMLVTQKARGAIRYPVLSSTYKESLVHEAYEGSVGFYCNYSKEGNLLIGGVNEFVGEEDKNTLFAFENISRTSLQYFPHLANVNILRSFARFYIHTPDLIPILGRVDEVEGFIMARGHNDYGISLGAITGRLISELACLGETSIPIQDFNLRRFS